MLLEEQEQEEINLELWRICQNFRDETNIRVNYIEYISLLLYIKYLKNDVFNKLYEIRKYYYIAEEIDKEINNIRENTKDKILFNNISFKNITVSRKIGEESVICKTIEQIHSLISNLELKYMESKPYIAMAYEYILMRVANNNELITKGEFYTPKGIAKILINALGIKEGNSIYDPSSGCGSFLINATRDKNLKVVGKAENLINYNLCLTNIFLHNIKNYDIQCIEKDGITNKNKKYDFVLTNPPFAVKGWKNKYLDNSDIDFFYKFRII